MHNAGSLEVKAIDRVHIIHLAKVSWTAWILVSEKLAERIAWKSANTHLAKHLKGRSHEIVGAHELSRSDSNTERAQEQESSRSNDFVGALDDAMETDAVNEGNHDTSEAVLKFNGMEITENGPANLCKHEHWLTDDIIGYSLHHVEVEYIKNNVDPGKNMVPL